MIKKIIALILLLAFATHTFSRVVIVVGFYTNQREIAATLCENKDKPVMKCEGKCQLSKKLKSEQKADEQNPERKIENRQQDISSRSFYSSLSIPFISDAFHRPHTADIGKPVHRSFAIFHPPITPVHFASPC